ncbi:hypothetical protein PUR61_03675 [Streptomyces sp. BE20]|nr:MULTISPECIES: hypothetical protein [unclassified Streptomyces]MEE1821301.1 hypothetical protein [Streptomyces sp. BE20]
MPDIPPTSPARMRRSSAGSMPTPSSSMVTTASAPASWAEMEIRHSPLRRVQPRAGAHR